MRCLPMINKHKKFLTAAVFCAIASTGFVLTASAEETMTHDLDEVVVEADKDALPGSYVKTKGSIGILGEKSILDVPFSNMVLFISPMSILLCMPVILKILIRALLLPANMLMPVKS